MLHEASSRADVPGAGRFVAAGPHRLYVEVAGAGWPAVVFEPGLGGTAADWAQIQAVVAAAGFAGIAYDRAGHGRSGPARDARRSDQVAADLHALLGQIVRPPFVLVGHSLGGVHVRAFARYFPELVAGMVLVESSHPRQDRATPPSLVQRLRDAARGSLRLFVPPPTGGLHDARSFARELRAFARCAGQPDALAPGALGTKPLAVLTAAPPAAAGERPSWESWHALHAELAQISRNSRHLVAPAGGHDLHRDAPEAVIMAVLAVCRAARDGRQLQLG